MTNSASNDFLGGEVAAPEQAAPAADQTAAVQETFSTLVGEGKRFKSPEELAKAKLEADNHIRRIEEENATLRQKVEGMDNNYKTILTKLEEKSNANVSAKTNQDAPVVPKEEIDLDTWFEAKLSAKEAKRIAEANMAACRNRMVETYGNIETAKKVRDEFLQAKPYMATALNTLLETDPEQFMREITSFKSPQEVGGTAVDPVGNMPGGRVDANSRYITWAEANEVRKKDIKRYNSPEFDKLIRESAAYYKSKGINYYS